VLGRRRRNTYLGASDVATRERRLLMRRVIIVAGMLAPVVAIRLRLTGVVAESRSSACGLTLHVVFERDLLDTLGLPGSDRSTAAFNGSWQGFIRCSIWAAVDLVLGLAADNAALIADSLAKLLHEGTYIGDARYTCN
jgi:hypothetical protein